MFELPGLELCDGDDPRQRRACLAAMSDEELTNRVVSWMLALRQVDAEAIAALAQLPLGEVIASPFGLRAVAMGLQVGATSVHREVRALTAWPFGVEDVDHGAWNRGVLHVGKYQSFQCEAPMAVYNPAHGAKWGPHELMHRAVGFFFRPTMSRFELYLGARLNELLPVVLWYGHDQLARLQEDGFERPGAPADPSDARWWVEDEPSLRARVSTTLQWLRAGLEHLADELAAIDEELETARRVSTPRAVGAARLDAASDATAYVVGHWARLQDPAVQATLARAPHHNDIRQFREHVELTHDALLFGTLTLDTDVIAPQRHMRMTWDWMLRAALVDPPGALRLLETERMLGDHEAWRADIEANVDGAEIVLADGLEGLSIAQLHDGLSSVTPRTAALMSPQMLTEFAVRAPSRGALVARLEEFLAETAAPWWPELVRLEAMLAAEGSDAAVPHLCDETGDHLMRNERFRLFDAAHDVVAVHAGELDEAPAGDGWWLVGRSGDDVVVLDVDEAVRGLWQRFGTQSLRMSEVVAVVGTEGVHQLLALQVLGRFSPPEF